MITAFITGWQKWLVASLVLVTLSGCTVKFYYNQLDWLTGWYLSDYVRLTPEQTPLFDARLKSILQWHRQQALPEYALFFERIVAAQRDGLSVQEWASFQSEFEGFVDALLLESSDSLSAVFMQMSDAQVAQLQAGFDKANQEYLDEFVAVAEVEQRQARAEKMQAFIERFSGTLNAEQQALILAWSQRYALMGNEFLSARVAWQNALLQLLNTRQDVAHFTAALPRVLLNRKAHHSALYQAKFAENQALLFELFSALSASFTAAQTQAFADKLKELAADFRALSRQ